MRSALIRALRTFLQAFIGTLIASGIVQGVTSTGAVPGWSAWESVFFSAFASGIVATLTWLQNVLEVTDRLDVMPRD
jgi:hypothetical protein